MISYSYAKPKVQPEPEEDATFKLKKETKDLKHLDIIWNLALECQNENVVPKAIDFLIKSYTSFVDEIEFESSDQLQVLIDDCMSRLSNETDEARLVRLLKILENICLECEKTGTGDVQPHNTLLKGEFLDRLQVKNKSNHRCPLINIKMYSNTTVWELKK